MHRTNPEDPEDWQRAVDAANALMVIEASRDYGLIVGGPEVDVGRCVEILAEGARRGIRPRHGSPVEFVAAWNADVKGTGDVDDDKTTGDPAL